MGSDLTSSFPKIERKIPMLSLDNTYDEAELCKLLLEISLLDSAYQRSTASRDDVLMDAAKRYRVDTEKLQKVVAQEFAAKLAKTGKGKSAVGSKEVA